MPSANAGPILHVKPTIFQQPMLIDTKKMRF